MSGIAGIIHFDGKPVEPGLIEKMTGAMAHRGPDGIHHWVKGSVALGQCMLRTTPESLEEHQPLTNEDESLVLVMDGRVDNWEELRQELLARGAVLRTRADAELVLRAYEIWGRDCLTHIDGDFALLIWDTQRREAFCARDRMGHKPFYYQWNGNTLAFASDINTILKLPWVEEQPNEEILAEALAWERHSRSETLWRNVLRLVAAHRIVFGLTEAHQRRYWEPNISETLKFSKDEEYFEYYRNLLLDIVRRMARSHKPVAIDVSGGLDSTAVFYMAEQLRHEGTLLAPAIEGYTLACIEYEGADDLPYARAVGEHLGICIHEVPPSKMPLSWYAECARVDRELPVFPNGAMHVGLWREAANRGSRVTLSGVGGDHWLSGSHLYYLEAIMRRRWRELLSDFAADVSIANKRQAIYWMFRFGLFPLLPRPFQVGLMRLRSAIRLSYGRDKAAWLSPRLMKNLKHARIQSSQCVSKGWAGQARLEELLYSAFDASAKEQMERLTARFCQVEQRHPLNDYRLVQFAFSTPERLRLRAGQSKYIHVQALRNVMPKVIVERRNKADFSGIFREALEPLQEYFTASLPRERSMWFARDGMQQLFKTFINGQQGSWPMFVLWSILGCDSLLGSEGSEDGFQENIL